MGVVGVLPGLGQEAVVPEDGAVVVAVLYTSRWVGGWVGDVNERGEATYRSLPFFMSWEMGLRDSLVATSILALVL